MAPLRVGEGRRQTDRIAVHGTRARYQKGCTCPPCRGAEAGYRAALRRRRVKGLPILGQLIGASEAWARIRTLQLEHFTANQITGWADPHGYRLTAQSRIRLSTLIHLRLLCAQYLIADTDLPMHQPYRDDSQP